MGIGGAMDLATGCDRVIVLMTHRSKRGAAKLLHRCTYPLTAPGVVSRVITDLGVFDPAGDVFRVVELADDVTLEEAAAATAASVVDASAGGSSS